jgi:UDP-GlcNAc3NAcA epimerase
MKVFTVVGARPQFIKAAVVSHAINETEGLEEVLVHTGQHFDANMSQVFFEQMRIPKPTHNLGINGVSHGKMTGRMLEGLEELMLKEKPDMVLVYGDTNSTLAGALAASKQHIPVAHVEAGLRSFNMKMPEEINRILTDRISAILFCPTDTALQNLSKEGFVDFDIKIVPCGDVMYDASLHFAQVADQKQIEIPKGKYILTTLHREENTSSPERLSSIVEALNKIHKEIPVYMPLHPGTANRLKSIDVKPQFNLLEPLGYLEMIKYIKGAKLIMTDSGGLQKEAYFFGKYCITMREETEWIELVSNGFNQLAGWKKEQILQAFEIASDKEPFETGALYGDGDAAKKIASSIAEYFDNTP